MRFYPRKENHISSPALAGFLTGFTLIEIMVYVAILAVISAFLLQTLISFSAVYRKVQAERDVLANARGAMETLGLEIRGAKNVYTPTSALSATTSQLSLATSLSSNVNEALTYVDFYVDNKRLYSKREGAAASPITSENVEVAEFLVERVTAGTRESARITLTLTSALRGPFQASSTITAAFTPRGNY
ncbi:MAG: prepilin-type N-terminal cleavage/methylation domain-containing protein [Candidatus Sungbacteria bacterium]|nr:prepilin-type N-terminal cleavage/methylation domain-containing protein [Candidatus Sungbacteria bacterium]